MSKVATVLLIEGSTRRNAAFDEACDVCQKLIAEKLMFAPADEVAVVHTGIRLPEDTPHRRVGLPETPRNVIFHEMSRVSAATLAAVEAVRQSRKCMLAAPASPSQSAAVDSDFVETLLAGTGLLLEKKRSKACWRSVVYYFSDLRFESATKPLFYELRDALLKNDIALVVVGIDVEGACNSSSALPSLHDAQTPDRCGLPSCKGSPAAQAGNTAILRAMCTELGPPSTVVSLDEARASLEVLQCRRIRQRSFLRVVLRLGEVRLATQLFVLTQEERMPALQQCLPGGGGVMRVAQYEAVGSGERAVVAEDDVSEAFFFGADRVPCSAAERAAMTITGPRAMEAIAFVKISDVDPVVLMGATRAVLPLAGDHAGQRGYNALVKAMQLGGKAMLVRLVFRRDAAPKVYACFPQPSPGSGVPACLVMAPLPFADDVRGYTFSEYPEVAFTEAEERMVDELIDGLTVDADVLAPETTFNPLIQQYYATVEAKLIAQSTPSTSRGGGRTAAVAGASHSAVVPPLLDQLVGTSTDFFSGRGPVFEAMQACRDVLERCAKAFPYEEEEEEEEEEEHSDVDADHDVTIVSTRSVVTAGQKVSDKPRSRRSGDRQRQSSSGVVDVDVDVDVDDESDCPPSTVAAAAVTAAVATVVTVDDSDAATIPRPPLTPPVSVAESCDVDAEDATPSVAHTLPHLLPPPTQLPPQQQQQQQQQYQYSQQLLPHEALPSSSATYLAESVRAFYAAVAVPGVTVAQLRKAKDDLSLAVEAVLRGTVKGPPYAQCVECMRIIRERCLQDRDAHYYNNLLCILRAVARKCGCYEGFWMAHVVGAAGAPNSVQSAVWPITAAECETSVLRDKAAAEAFLRAAVPI